MTVVEKNCDNCDRDRNGDEVHPTVILPKKGAIHPFVEVYSPLEQPRSVGLLIIFSDNWFSCQFRTLPHIFIFIIWNFILIKLNILLPCQQLLGLYLMHLHLRFDIFFLHIVLFLFDYYLLVVLYVYTLCWGAYLSTLKVEDTLMSIMTLQVSTYNGDSLYACCLVVATEYKTAGECCR